MKALLLTAAGGVAVVAASFTRATPQDTPVNPNPPVVVEQRRGEPQPRTRVTCPSPCAHCAITPKAPDEPAPLPPRREPPPETEGDPTQPPTPIGEPNPPSGETNPTIGETPTRRSRTLTVSSTVTLNDGTRYLCSANVPSDRQGFAWTQYRSRANPDRGILGLHLYAHRRDATLVVGTARFSNAAVRPDGTGFCGAVYYDSLTMTAPAGWEWVTLPMKGQTVSGSTWVLAASEADDDHLARPRMMLEWPYALIPAGDEATRARAIAALKYEDLVIPDPVVDYGPARSQMPTVDRGKYAEVAQAWAGALLQAQATGGKVWIENIADVQNPALGPHWCDGSIYGYAHGGYGIDPTAAAPEQVPAAVLARAIMHRANVARSFMGAFNLDTGKPIGLYEWKYPPNAALMKGEPGKEGTVELTPFLVGDYYTYRYARFNSGRCSYENAHAAQVNGAPVWVPGLWDYEAHDIAHSIRAMRNAIALIEYVRDPAARDFLLMVAENNRYGWYSDRPDETTPTKNPGQGYYPKTLTLQLEQVRANPGKGAWVERNWAWSAFAGACALEYEPDPARRETWKAWGRNMLEFATRSADKFGFACRSYSPGNMPASVAGIQTFHEMLVIAHRVTLAMRVNDGRVPELIVEVNLRALRSALATLAPRPYGGSVGPPHWIGTMDSNVELPALDEAHAYGAGDPAHVWAACAMTYRANPATDEALTLSLPHWAPATDLAARYGQCKSIVPNKAWSSELESVLQQRQ